MNPANYYY